MRLKKTTGRELEHNCGPLPSVRATRRFLLMGSRSQYWIFGPVQDLSFILFTPLPILFAFAIARSTGRIDALIAFGLALAMAAKAHLETALRIDPEYALAHNNLGG